MGTTLTGAFISQTYDSLIKVTDNDNLTSTAKRLTDGLGNDSPLFLSTDKLGVGITPTTTFQVSGNSQLGGNLTVTGNLIVQGTTTTVDTDTLSVKDPLIIVGSDNTSSDAVDLGFYGVYDTSGSLDLFAGLFRDASDGKFHLFKDVQVEPTTTVNKSATGYTVATLVGNLEGTLTGTIASTTVATTQSASDNSTKVATTAYVDNQVTIQDLDFAGDSNTGSVDLDSQTFTIAGTTNEIETSASGQTLTVGLPSTVAITTKITSPIFGLGEGTSNKIQFIGSNGNWRINISDSANQFVIHSESLVADYFTVIGGGGIKLNAYGSGSKTGTVAKNLAVDSSGNIIETDGGVVDGSGTANDVVMWSDSNTLTDAPIAISSNDATFAGAITTTSATGIKIDTTGNAILELDGASGSTEAIIFRHSGTEVSRIAHSNSTSLVFSTGSSVTAALTLDASQNATFAGSITIPEYIVHSGDTDTFFGFVTDNEYKVTVGNSTKIFADANSAYLYHQGSVKLNTTSGGVLVTGDINLSGTAIYKNSGTLEIKSEIINIKGVTTNENIAGFNENGSVDLYHDNSKKLETTSTGVSVTGDLTATSGKFISTSSSSGDYVRLYAGSGTAQWDIYGSGETLRLSENSSGGGIFQVDSGASFGSDVAIGGTANTYSNQTVLTINGSTYGRLDLESSNTLRSSLFAGSSNTTLDVASGFFTIDVGGSEAIRIDTSGNVGIENTNPVTLKSATTLQVNGNAKLGDANDRGLLSLGDIASTGANAGIWRGAAGAYGSAGNFLNIGGYDGIVFTTGNADISSQTTALTLDSSQNATFAGNITSTGTSITLDSAGSADYIADRANDTSGATYQYKTNGTIKWYHGLRGVSSDDFFLFNYGTGANALHIETSNSKANFSGDISLDNTGSGDRTLTISTTTGGDPIIVMNSDASNRSGLIRYQDNGTNIGRIEYVHNGDRIDFQAGSSTGATMSIENNAVGIGETNPLSDLTVRSDSSGGRGGEISIVNYASNATGNEAALNFGLESSTYNADLSNAQIKARVNNGANAASDLIFSLWNGSAFGEKMRLHSDGNLGIGTNSILSGNRLDVRGGNIMVGGFGGGTDYGLILTPDDGSGYWNIANVTGGVLTFNNSSTIGSSEQMRLTTTGLGIGTSPNQTGFGTDETVLTVKGKASGKRGILELIGLGNADNDTVGILSFMSQSATQELASIKGLRHTSDESGKLTFSTNDSEAMRIDQDGNVGIGSNSPSSYNAQLVSFKDGGSFAYLGHNNSGGTFPKVSALSFGSSAVSFSHTTNGGTNALTGSAQIAAIQSAAHNAPTDMVFYTTAGGSVTEGMRLSSSGNLGIDNTSPNAPLQFNTSVATRKIVLYENANNDYEFYGFGIEGNTLIYSTGSNTDNHVFFSAQSSSSRREIARFNGNGDILFGTSTKANDFTYLELATNNRRILNIGSSTTSQQTLVNFRNPNGVVGELQTDGSTTSFVTSSDYRLKENVVEMTDALDRVSQLKPSRFNFIANPDKTYDGFLAHEVQDIVPEAISGEKDEVDEDGNEKYQGIDQSKLVPLLVGAIQELKAEIEILKNK